MEQQKLPNVTTSIVLGILSFICCCFSMGIGGIIMSGISLFLVGKDKKTYAENPEAYSNYGSLSTARIIAIIGLVLAVLTLGWSIFQIQSLGGWEAYQEQVKEMMEEFGVPAE